MPTWDDTKPCECGKLMVLCSAGAVLASYPAQYPTLWKCYGCGHSEDGPTIRDKTTEEQNRERWEEANQEATLEAASTTVTRTITIGCEHEWQASGMFLTQKTRVGADTTIEGRMSDEPRDRMGRTEAEIRAIFPEAVWMPWDDPPVGQRVKWYDDTDADRVGVIQGRYAPPPPAPCHHCPTCTCMSMPNDNLSGFWEVRHEGWWSAVAGYERTDDPRPGAEPMVTLEHPCYLKPVLEEA